MRRRRVRHGGKRHLDMHGDDSSWRLSVQTMEDPKLCVIFAGPPASFPRTLGPRRCIEVDGPVGPEARIGRWTGLSIEEAIQGKMVPHRLLSSPFSTLQMNKHKDVMDYGSNRGHTFHAGPAVL